MAISDAEDNMSAKKNIKLKVSNPLERESFMVQATPAADMCDINIQVANGWEIIGHYRDQILQTITLQKSKTNEV